MIDIDEIFEGAAVPPWLRRLAENPADAIADLLIGRADLGMYGAEEPDVLLLDWLSVVGDKCGFASHVDDALARWIENSWGKPELVRGVGSASLTSTAWCRAAAVIAMDKRMDKAAVALRTKVLNDSVFLSALHEGRSRDPLGRAWLAIARHQQDRDLVDRWWRLCSLPPDEPWYRGDYGIHGLRGMPRENESEGTGFPREVAEGLLVLGKALKRRAEEGWLDNGVAQEEFLATARLTMAAYPFERDWKAYWWQAADRSRLDWIGDLVDLTRAPTGASLGRQSGAVRAVPNWKNVTFSIADELAKRDLDALAKADKLLSKQRTYAEATGDVDFVVKSACNLAGVLEDWMPEKALEWTELARRYDSWNPFGWTTGVTCLAKLSRLQEALRMGLEAIERFPDNDVARNGLAEVLKAQGHLEEAEEAYRENIRDFPDDVVARTGLAEVFKAQGRLPEAEQAYRDTIRDFPDSAYARNGLQSVLRLLSGEADTEPAAPQPQPAENLGEQDIETILSDALILHRWGRWKSEDRSKALEKARDLLERLSKSAEWDPRAAEGCGLLLLDSLEIEDAAKLLRLARQRFPGSVRVRYALSQAERLLAEASGIRLEAGTDMPLVRPLRDLVQMDARYRPIAMLGEARAYLTLKDGEIAEEKARDAFGRLGRFMSRHEEPPVWSDKPGDEFPWSWSAKARDAVFGDRLYTKADDIEDLTDIRKRVAENSELLDELEGDYVYRYAVV